MRLIMNLLIKNKIEPHGLHCSCELTTQDNISSYVDLISFILLLIN